MIISAYSGPLAQPAEQLTLNYRAVVLFCVFRYESVFSCFMEKLSLYLECYFVLSDVSKFVSKIVSKVEQTLIRGRKD